MLLINFFYSVFASCVEIISVMENFTSPSNASTSFEFRLDLLVPIILEVLVCFPGIFLNIFVAVAVTESWQVGTTDGSSSILPSSTHYIVYSLAVCRRTIVYIVLIPHGAVRFQCSSIALLVYHRLFHSLF